jgi:hypothetical protein
VAAAQVPRAPLPVLNPAGLRRATLGELALNHFVEAKRAEWDVYRTQVSDWEVDRYLEQIQGIFRGSDAVGLGAGGVAAYRDGSGGDVCATVMRIRLITLDHARDFPQFVRGKLSACKGLSVIAQNPMSLPNNRPLSRV